MMITPPLSVRQVRPCEICIFNRGHPVVHRGEWTHICTINKFADFYGYNYREHQPCDDNFTISEMKQLIDHYNQQEQS